MFVLFYDIFYIFCNVYLLFLIDITPNCDNTRDVHGEIKGSADLQVIFNQPTQKTITVIMYTAVSGGVSVSKDFNVQLLSSDY